jgi:hypothetical protein
MNLAPLAIWVTQVLAMILVCYVVFADARYTLRRRASKNWPSATATIDSGSVGFRGPLSGLPSILYRVHFTYSYCVDGSKHDGRFFLLTNSKNAGEGLRQKLVGRSVPVKYNDRKPEVSLLMDQKLAGKRVMQGPSGTYH